MTQQDVNRFAATLSDELIGLAHHRPEPWAENGFCFANAWRKAEECGGRAVFGWYFQPKLYPEFGEYLIAMHHAVWHSPDLSLVDVTPFHQNPDLHPISFDGNVLFKLNMAAEPMTRGPIAFPLPSRYFAPTDDAALVGYCAKLQREEIEACRAIYEGREPPPGWRAIR